jgi:hypothetical protein
MTLCCEEFLTSLDVALERLLSSVTPDVSFEVALLPELLSAAKEGALIRFHISLFID